MLPKKASIYTVDLPAFTGGACSGDYGILLHILRFFRHAHREGENAGSLRERHACRESVRFDRIRTS